MAIIPNDEKVFMVSNTTNTTYSGSQALKDMNEWYTMEDVKNTVLPYKVYTALVTQSGTDAPVATVLENTLGVITLQRNELGDYSILSDNLFLDGKTFMPQSFSFDAEQSVIPYADDSSINGHYSFWKTSEGDIKIFMYNNTGTFVEWSTALGTSFELPIEIRVYN
jgi:hypothetical protein